MAFPVVLLLLAFLFTSLPLSQGRREGKPCPAPCGPNECCSQYGFCGSTDQHCGRTPDTNCDQMCGPGECCSRWGWCGTTWEHCGRLQPTSESPSPPDRTEFPNVPPPSQFDVDMLNLHNEKRTRYGLNALSWNGGITASAQNYANGLIPNGCPMVHSSNERRQNVAGFGQVGENLAYCERCQDNDVARDAFGRWWNEVTKYRFHPFSPSDMEQNLGHITQLMWQKTTDLGCAKVRCGDRVLTVCQYGPAGNYYNEEPFSRQVAERIAVDYPNILS